MRAQTSLTLGIVAAAALSGCASDGMEIGTESQEICSTTYGCGDNSAVINEYPIHELDLDHHTSPEGFRYLNAVTPGGTVGFLDVKDGDIYIYFRNGSYIKGAETVGSDIRVRFEDGSNPPADYNIKIEGYAPEPSWVEERVTVPAYYLTYWKPGGDRVPLCRAPNPRDPGQALVTPAILIRGERYDRDYKTVLDPAAVPSANWFNIACAGSALAKMRLMNYDPENTIGNEYYTGRHQRQATLKMITADYCGSGHSFTESGTPLRWQNRAQWCQAGTCAYYPDPALGLKTEAIWDDNGVVCLDTPRLDMYTRSDVEAACGYAIPTCDNYSAGDGEWQTFLPL